MDGERSIVDKGRDRSMTIGYRDTFVYQGLEAGSRRPAMAVAGGTSSIAEYLQGHCFDDAVPCANQDATFMSKCSDAIRKARHLNFASRFR